MPCFNGKKKRINKHTIGMVAVRVSNCIIIFFFTIRDHPIMGRREKFVAS